MFEESHEERVIVLWWVAMKSIGMLCGLDFPVKGVG